jgi:hypothetical protein
MHSANRHREADFASRFATPRWPAASPAVCGGLFEEAATPGQPGAYRSTLLEEPSQPFTLENRWAPPALPQCSGRARRTSRSMSVNVRPHAFHIKQKPKPHCAETVDAGDSLWKLVENQDGCRSRRATIFDYAQSPMRWPSVNCPNRQETSQWSGGRPRPPAFNANTGCRCMILRTNSATFTPPLGNDAQS